MHHAASRLEEAAVEMGQAVELLRTVERPDLLAAPCAPAGSSSCSVAR
jgi:hypothetical protein